ncbi:MAG: T9SS type A sorting domain-containing protein [Bacteroidetes bacterium]|nr:T9SS type A sorting domain-containing protein [Bacteroidota bacterium]
MKKLLFLAVFMLFINQLKSQDFAPIGAKWHYTEKFAFSGNISYKSIQSIGKTIKKGKLCSILTNSGGFDCYYHNQMDFVYQEDSIVYFYLAAIDSFQVLYNLKAKKDTMWNVIFNTDIYPLLDTFRVKVDSVSSVNINGKDLKKMFVYYQTKSITGYYSNFYPSVIIENLGDIYYLFNLGDNHVACDGNYSEGLRCYSDSLFGFYSSGIAPFCTYTGINETKQDIIEIYPNPATDLLNIKTTDGNTAFIELRNTLGQVVYSTYFKSEISVNLKSYPKGLYFVSLREKDKILAVKKILKN